jgi:hypothetical protein
VRSKRVFLVGIVGLFLAMLLVVAAWILGEDSMYEEYINPVRADGKIIMLYGSIFKEGRFDATRWFKNGMYRLRDIENPSDSTMLRESVPPIPDNMLVRLRAVLTGALDPNSPYYSEEDGLPPPASFEKILMYIHFDPRPQLLYYASKFREIDKPRDIYAVYLLIEGERYFVNLERDGVTGEIKRRSRATYTSIRADDAREDWLFKRLEERQNKPTPPPKDTEYPAAVLEKNPCPKSGYWWTAGVEGERYFEKGQRMPEVSAGYGQAIWYRVQE